MNLAEDIEYLIKLLSCWEISAYIAIAAVAIGVLGEVIHDFTSWFKRIKWWAEKGNKYSAILLVVALFAELGIQIKENSISGRIIAAQQRETAGSRERAAKLEIELVRLKEQRRIKDVKKFLDILRPFAGTSFDLAVADEPDSIRFGAQIGFLLRDSANWHWEADAVFGPMSHTLGNPPSPQVGYGDWIGLVVELVESERDKFEKPALALRDALRGADFDANFQVMPDAQAYKGTLPNRVHLTIGARN